jgi:hypothetical protein
MPRKSAPRKPKPIKVDDRVILKEMPHLGAFMVYGIDDGCASIIPDNPIPLEELQHSSWESNSDEQPEVETAPEIDDRQGKLESLRARLKRLDLSDEISDCSARFKVEKAIYDIEQSMGADEWPEFLGD